MLFEYRAADWNPALALRMRAIGEEFQGERWRGAGSKCSGLRGRGGASAIRRASMAGRYVAVVFADVVVQAPAKDGG